MFVAIVGVAENSKEEVAGLKTKNWERYELKRLKPQRARRVQTSKSTCRGVKIFLTTKQCKILKLKVKMVISVLI